MNEIEALFEDKSINRSGIFLYSKENALQIIDECKKRNIVLLGIDGFYLGENTTEPSMENSVDFSMRPFTESIYEDAIAFLKARNDRLHFEIVYSEG
ncbi:MAG: hypothetical protein P4L51_22320 [Puia sp.]|nr:hypothetical protein [Puia sp.]